MLECPELNYLNVLSAATIVTGQIPKPGGLTGRIATLPGCEEDISSSGFKNLFIRVQEPGEVSESNCKLIFYLYLTNLGLLECPELNYLNVLSAATIVTGQIPKPGGLTGRIATLPGCEEDISSSGFKNLFIRVQEPGEVSESNCKLIFYLYLTNLGLLECPELNYSNIVIIFIL